MLSRTSAAEVTACSAATALCVRVLAPPHPVPTRAPPFLLLNSPPTAPQPLLGLLGGHAAQICVRALHLARLPLGHLLGHIVRTHALHAVGRADGRADMLKKTKKR